MEIDEKSVSGGGGWKETARHAGLSTGITKVVWIAATAKVKCRVGTEALACGRASEW
jgi:hypothetical protein